jgi:hypothetical protein
MAFAMRKGNPLVAAVDTATYTNLHWLSIRIQSRPRASYQICSQSGLGVDEPKRQYPISVARKSWSGRFSQTHPAIGSRIMPKAPCCAGRAEDIYAFIQ